MKQPIYKTLEIYYFSGTGNAENCAKWIAEVAGNAGIKTNINNIVKADVQKISKLPKGCLAVFCAPTHGFNFPVVMRKFIARFPKSLGADAIVLNTRAGTRIFKIVFPGLSGIALYSASLTLFLKGYGIRGLMPVDLPSNWISLHPALRKKSIDIIFNKQKKKIFRFAEKIISGKRSYIALFDVIQDIAISPVALLYNYIGRFVIAKSFFATRDCTNCMLCLKQCPVNAIKELDGRMYWSFKCESCMKCMNICPVKAIETGHGFIALAAVVSYFMAAMVIKLLSQLFPFYEIYVDNLWSLFAIWTLIMLPVLWLSYGAVHYLMRFKFIERLNAYASLTHLKFWGRYNAPKMD